MPDLLHPPLCHSPAHPSERESQNRLGMANHQDLHRFLAKQNQEGDEQTVDGNAFCKTHEDQGTTQGFGLLSNGADGGCPVPLTATPAPRAARPVEIPAASEA